MSRIAIRNTSRGPATFEVYRAAAQMAALYSATEIKADT
jgi:hypothetical protein